jgi:hypothetical protein
MAAHILATALSVLPLPGWSTAADAAAYGLNLAIKLCPPDLIPPSPIVVNTPSEGCSHIFQLPLPRDYRNIVQVDRIVIEELLNDPAIYLARSIRIDLEAALMQDFGRFSNHANSAYVNVYGIALPVTLSRYTVPHWGDIGSPRVFHYNTDVMIELTHPGTRIDANRIEIPVGNHNLRWEGETLISDWDYVPLFLATAGMSAYKAYKAKKTKRFAIKAGDTAFQRSVQQMLREGRDVVFYLHPREVDPGHPQLPMSARRRFMSYVNIHTTGPKLRTLFRQLPFTTFEQLLRERPPAQ